MSNENEVLRLRAQVALNARRDAWRVQAEADKEVDRCVRGLAESRGKSAHMVGSAIRNAVEATIDYRAACAAAAEAALAAAKGSP